MPDRYWDAKAGVKYADWTKDHNELAAYKAAEDSKKLTNPASPDAFKIQNSKNFKAPEGSAMNWNAEDTGMKMAREFAHKNGFSQDQFEQMLDLYAGQQLASQQAFQTRFESEKAKLGAAAQSRMDAVNNFVNASASPDAAKALLGGLWTAEQVVAIEEIMAKFRSQGAGSFSQAHRDVGSQEPSDEQYNKMSFAEKMQYAQQKSNGANGAQR